MKLSMKASILLSILRLYSFTNARLENAQTPLQLEDSISSTKAMLALHKELVQIDSISGNEHAVATYLDTYLSSHNFTVESQTVGPMLAESSCLPTTGEVGQGQSSTKGVRRNILAYKGKSRKSRVLMSSHIDTVPPFLPYEIHDGAIWGRGTVDAKGAVATQITAVEELLVSGDIEDGDVALLFVVGEEVGGDGMRKANDLGLEWETVIFGEPTELKLASGHKGHLSFTVSAQGKAGHSGYPWLGESANSMLLPALVALDNMQLPSSEKYGNTTVNIGRMEGGVAANVIAERASAKIAMRLAAGSAMDAANTVLELVGKMDERLKVKFVSRGYGPVDIDHDVEGFDTIVCNYGTDIPNLKGDHKRYLYGPGSVLVAHSVTERLNVDDLKTAVMGYKKLIEAALKASPS